MILEYLSGKTLDEYIKLPLTKEQIIDIAQQIMQAQKDMRNCNIIPWDFTLDNIMITNADNKVKLLDPAAYLDVDELIKINKQSYSSKDFNILIAEKLSKLVEQMRPKLDNELNKKYGEKLKWFEIAGIKYYVLPPLQLYISLVEAVDVYSALLAKLDSIEHEKNDNTTYEPKKYWESYDTFGSKDFPINPTNEVIKKRAFKLLSKIKYFIDNQPNYTESDFKKDVIEANKIYELIHAEMQKRLSELSYNIKKKLRFKK